MTAVVSVVNTGSGAQIVFGIAVAMVFMKLYAYYLPFKDHNNNVLQEVQEEDREQDAFVFFTLFSRAHSCH